MFRCREGGGETCGQLYVRAGVQQERTRTEWKAGHTGLESWMARGLTTCFSEGRIGLAANGDCAVPTRPGHHRVKRVVRLVGSKAVWPRRVQAGRSANGAAALFAEQPAAVRGDPSADTSANRTISRIRR